VADETSGNKLAFTCVFRTTPRGGDLSGVRCLLEAVRHSVNLSIEQERKEQLRLGQGANVTEADQRKNAQVRTKHISLLVRLVACKMVQADLQVLRPDCTLQLPVQHCSLIRLCCRQLAHAASKQAARDAPDNKEITSSTQLFDVKRTIMAIEAKIKNVEDKQKESRSLHSIDRQGVPPELRLSSTAATTASAKQPLFGRMRYDRDVDAMAGKARTPPIFRPIQMTSVPDHVATFHDVAVCLHQCAKVCTRLANQSHLVKNSFCLRTALIQHVFTHVIPLPLPSTHPQKNVQCFWHGKDRNMRYETQSDIMRSLHMVAQHFSCASLSLRLTRSFDAERILTSTC